MAAGKFNGDAMFRQFNEVEDPMKMKSVAGWCMIPMVLLSMAMIAGCDDAEKGSALVVEPPESSVSGAGATVFLTARMVDEDDDAILPLSWHVQHPALGNILSAAGMTAVYRSNGAMGQNVVFCQDHLGREGLAVINQNGED